MTFLCRLFGHWYMPTLRIFGGTVSHCRICKCIEINGVYVDSEDPLHKAVFFTVPGKSSESAVIIRTREPGDPDAAIVVDTLENL